MKEPKFKAGEVVSPNFYEGLPENMWITCDPYFYIGKRKNGKIAIENRSGSVYWCWGVRKIDKDPDKKYKDAAKEMMTKEGIGDIGGYTHVVISPGKLESMLIEALKKGKGL